MLYIGLLRQVTPDSFVIEIAGIGGLCEDCPLRNLCGIGTVSADHFAADGLFNVDIDPDGVVDPFGEGFLDLLRDL